MENDNDSSSDKFTEAINRHKELFSGKQYLEVVYQEEFDGVVVSANELTLKYLQDLIQALVGSKTEGAHFQLDRSFGLEGNVSSLIIVKKIE
jgi:hypothetical protein